MKNKVNILYTAVLGLLLSFSSYGQVTLQAGGGAGLVFPSGDYGGSTIDYYTGTQYGLSAGFNLHGKIRAGFTGIIVTGELGYSSFNNSGESLPGQGKIDISHSIISIKAGPEYHISLPASPVAPYVGLNLLMSIIDGETQFLGVSAVPSGTFNMESAARVGLGFRVGGIVTASPVGTLDIGLEYDLINLFGKNFEDISPGTEERLDSYVALNDDADPLYNPNSADHFIYEARSINVIQLSVTVMFGI